MSKEEEVKQFIKSISDDVLTKAYYIEQCAEKISRFTENFSSFVEGTNVSSAKDVYVAFFSVRKELLNAAKSTAEAARAGYDWCEGTQKTFVKKLR